MVKIGELKKLYKKALAENRDYVIVDDDLGKARIPIEIVKRVLSDMEKEKIPDDVEVGLTSARNAPEHIKKELSDFISGFKQYKKGIEVETLDAMDKIHPIWDELGLKRGRALVEAIFQRAERAVDHCECSELITHRDMLNDGFEMMMELAANAIKQRKKETPGYDTERKISEISKDLSRAKNRYDELQSTFQRTCSCQKRW